MYSPCLDKPKFDLMLVIYPVITIAIPLIYNIYIYQYIYINIYIYQYIYIYHLFYIMNTNKYYTII
jgi:hypothetical protein